MNVEYFVNAWLLCGEWMGKAVDVVMVVEGGDEGQEGQESNRREFITWLMLF